MASTKPTTIDAGTRLLALARAQIGTTESPANTNKTKYGKWFGYDGLAWCGIFCSWVYHHAGMPLGKVGFTNGFAGCQTAVAHYRKSGEVVSEPQPGDLVFFDWNKDGRFDHVGLFERKINSKTFATIEGNTSLTNDSNGGTVMARERKFSAGVLFVRPKVKR